MQEGRNANGIFGCILFLGCLMASPVAHSVEYYFCMVFDTHREKLYYYSDILVAETDIDDMETRFAFSLENERRARRDFPNTQESGYCISEAKLSDAEKEYQKLLERYSHTGRKYPFTRPPVPSKPVVRNVSPVPAIIVEETKPVTPTPKQLAEQAAMEREAAANKARIAAARARHDARVQAAIAEQLRLRRSQGARQ